jgi:acyl-coenzyme A thioesterase PaaI-like protein
MHVTDLPINRTLGMRLANEADGHILELPESPLLLNHVGTIHASVQFASAEAGSGAFLLHQLAEAHAQVFAVLRTSAIKFRKPAHGALRASAQFAKGTADSLASVLAARGRALVSVLVEIADAQGLVFAAADPWNLACVQDPESINP